MPVNQEIRERLQAEVDNSSGLLMLLQELSQTVAAEDIVDTLIEALDIQTGFSEHNRTMEKLEELESNIRQYHDSQNRDELLVEIESGLESLPSPYHAQNLLRIAKEELLLEDGDELVQLLQMTYSTLMNRLMEE